jgi:O-antigen/teichoic acid export membrane protein
LSLIFLGVTCLENLATAWLAHRTVRTLSIRPRHITRAGLRECFSFSLFTALRGMAVRVIHLTDVIVIGAVVGKQAAVPYYIALRLVQMIHTPLEKIGDVVLPKAGDLHARGEHRPLEDLTARAMGLALLLAGAFCIGSVYFGGLFITTWMGPGLEQSRQILILLAAAQVVGQPLIVLRQTLMAVGDVRRTAYLDLAQAAANLALSLTLIYAMGIVGVAWGTLIPLLVCELGLLLPYGLRRLQFSGRRLFAHAVWPQLPALIAVGVYCEFVSRFGLAPGWLTVAAIAGGAVGVLGACWLARSSFGPRKLSVAR